MKLNWFKIIEESLSILTSALIGVLVGHFTGFTFLSLLLLPQLVKEGSILVSGYDAMLANAFFGILVGIMARKTVNNAFKKREEEKNVTNPDVKYWEKQVSKNAEQLSNKSCAEEKKP